jgi:hypothetical protein
MLSVLNHRTLPFERVSYILSHDALSILLNLTHQVRRCAFRSDSDDVSVGAIVIKLAADILAILGRISTFR